MYSDLFKMDRAGLIGLSCVAVGFFNLIFFSNENLILFGVMVILSLTSVFLVFKDRKEEEIGRYKSFLIILFISALTLFLLLSYYFQFGFN